MSCHSISLGAYTGELYDAWSLQPETITELQSVAAWVRALSPPGVLQRHAIVQHPLHIHGKDILFAIKSFKTSTFLRDLYFRKNGSKACRSFKNAVHLAERGVGTPKPLAYLDRWDNGRLVESYYICEYQQEITSFREELNRLYREDPLCSKIMILLEVVAFEIAKMHAAGLFHYDLGNQNILLRPQGDHAWKDIQFIDLNRARVSESLTLQQRARDISRIDLPSDFLRVFLRMYFGHRPAPAEFLKAERKYRRRFTMHTATRKFRHPIREAHKFQAPQDEGVPLRGRELWVWDDRSVQAITTMVSRERHTYYPRINHFYVLRGVIKSISPVHARYRDLMATAFSREVALEGRIGMAVGTTPEGQEQEQPLLAGLGSLPVSLRFYCHEKDHYNQSMLDYAKMMRSKGHTIYAALVQHRESVRNPSRWTQFVEKWLVELAGVADQIEVGHAVNRVKWGVWNLADYNALLKPVIEVSRQTGPFRLTGPAAIDFEYHILAALLDLIPWEGCLDALSHHLYVDRRGAPENRQGKYSAVEKFALAKAFASWSPAVKGDRLVVSEVNWPLLNTGIYSPVCSPYIVPGVRTNDPSVDEETYANYLLRYYMLALCSGFVDQVYWWRLVARGFGLVDDTETAWRPRPAYHALKVMIQFLGKTTFVEKLQTQEGVWVLRFRDENQSSLVMAWSHPESVVYRPTFSYTALYDRDGLAIEKTRETVTLSSSPVYFMGVE